MPLFKYRYGNILLLVSYFPNDFTPATCDSHSNFERESPVGLAGRPWPVDPTVSDGSTGSMHEVNHSIGPARPLPSTHVPMHACTHARPHTLASSYVQTQNTATVSTFGRAPYRRRRSIYPFPSHSSLHTQTQICTYASAVQSIVQSRPAELASYSIKLCSSLLR